MGDNSATLHEDPTVLGAEAIDRHRVIASIMEELEAVDWYNQRVDASEDPELREILIHNRDEEKEHAAMALEWLRRRDPELDRFLRQYLFTEGSITAIEVREVDQPLPDARTGGDEEAAPSRNGGSLGIGSLRGRSNR